MKNYLLILSIVLLGSSQTLFASSADLFKYDKEALQTEFADLVLLEEYILSNESVSLDDLKAIDHPYLSAIDMNTARTTSPFAAMFSIDDMDWGSFAWGFCCCPVGFFIVGISDAKSQNQKTSYWVGVIVSVVLSAISNGIYWGGNFSTF